MKTAVSNTKKESEDLKQLKIVIDATATYLNMWTEHQVSAISIKDKMPYIYPLDNLGYLIGHYRILNKKGEWQVRNSEKLIHIFSDKLSAIFFVLCELTHRYKISRRILLSDNEVFRLRNDVSHYENSVKRAKINKDYIRYDIWVARLTEATLALNQANQELRKSLTRAKYLKFWE